MVWTAGGRRCCRSCGRAVWLCLPHPAVPAFQGKDVKPMRVAYLANVGTRDVQRNGKPIAKPRPDGAALLAEFEKVRAELIAPILSAGIRQVLGNVARIDVVQLFVSDQLPPPATASDHHERDTVIFGELLGKILAAEFGERVARYACEPMRLNPAD